MKAIQWTLRLCTGSVNIRNKLLILRGTRAHVSNTRAHRGSVSFVVAPSAKEACLSGKGPPTKKNNKAAKITQSPKWVSSPSTKRRYHRTEMRRSK